MIRCHSSATSFPVRSLPSSLLYMHRAPQPFPYSVLGLIISWLRTTHRRQDFEISLTIHGTKHGKQTWRVFYQNMRHLLRTRRHRPILNHTGPKPQPKPCPLKKQFSAPLPRRRPATCLSPTAPGPNPGHQHRTVHRYRAEKAVSSRRRDSPANGWDKVNVWHVA